MNLVKGLLIVVSVGLALVMLFAAVVGFAATAGVVAVAESGALDEAAEAVAEAVEDVEIKVDGSVVDISGEDGARVRFTEEDGVLTITDQDGDRVRISAPRLGRSIERFFEEEGEHIFWLPALILAPLALLFKGFSALFALGLIALGVWLVVKNQQSVEKKAQAA